MMTTIDEKRVDDELLASRRAMWASFLKFSTYSIVGVALALILMALFLL